MKKLEAQKLGKYHRAVSAIILIQQKVESKNYAPCMINHLNF
jgi:hypothetical protein